MTEGIVNILKPPGMSSSDAVADVRHIFKIKRVGHCGTLDPGAAGVLPICVGRATRLFDILVDKEKEYIGEITLGAATDTQDAYGKTIAKDPQNKEITAEMLEEALKGFIGEIEQTAPMYSAVSIGGKRLYQLAREGAENVEIKRRAVIHGLEVVEQTGRNRFLLKIACSRGTYVRTLCNDIGKALGVHGYMSFLLRTKSGDFTIETAYSIAELKELKEKGELDSAVVPIEQVLCAMGDVRLENLGEKPARLIRNGAEIYVESLKNTPAGTLVKVYDENEFLGVGQTGKNGALHIKINLI